MISKTEDSLINSLKALPLENPPGNLTGSVMTAIQKGPVYPKKKWPARFRSWLLRPRTIVLTPARVIPATAAVLLIWLIPWFYFDSPPLPGSGTAEVLTHPGQMSDTLPASFSPTFPARFSLIQKDAFSVAVVGSFNNWKPQGFQMARDDSGVWTLQIYLPEGRHHYCFLINTDTLVHDPHALLNETDGFGATNSVLFLGSDYETTDS